MGVVTAAVSLIDALVKKNPEEYKGCISLAVARLSRVRARGMSECPGSFSAVLWIRIMLMRIRIRIQLLVNDFCEFYFPC